MTTSNTLPCSKCDQPIAESAEYQSFYIGDAGEGYSLDLCPAPRAQLENIIEEWVDAGRISSSMA